jgi:CHASE3 domain sensor protein
MSTLFAILLALAPQSGELDLEHVDPRIRLNAVENAGYFKSTQAIERVIARLEDANETAAIKAAAQEALKSITGRSEKDAAAWRAWWKTEGIAQFSQGDAEAKLPANLKEELKRARQDIRAITTVLAVAIFLFIIVMFFFVGHVSSKIKGWRELVSRAEVYVKHGQELTERTDKIAAELESKKAEVAAFLEKIRRDQEELISRRGEELGTDLAHQLRMELQTLRQKAERELDQTVTDLKTQIETTARRAAADVRDRLAK